MYCNICIRRINTYFKILYSNILHILFTPIYFSVTLVTCRASIQNFNICDKNPTISLSVLYGSSYLPPLNKYGEMCCQRGHTGILLLEMLWISNLDVAA